MPRRDRKEETAMRDKIRKTILPVILTVALAATAVVTVLLLILSGWMAERKLSV